LCELPAPPALSLLCLGISQSLLQLQLVARTCIRSSSAALAARADRRLRARLERVERLKLLQREVLLGLDKHLQLQPHGERRRRWPRRRRCIRNALCKFAGVKVENDDDLLPLSRRRCALAIEHGIDGALEVLPRQPMRLREGVRA